MREGHSPQVRKIALFGAGGHARAVIDALAGCGTPPQAVYDDSPSLRGASCPLNSTSLV